MAIATNLDAEERDALSVLENVPFFELDMQSVLQNLFCRIISGKEFHTVTSRGTE